MMVEARGAYPAWCQVMRVRPDLFSRYPERMMVVAWMKGAVSMWERARMLATERSKGADAAGIQNKGSDRSGDPGKVAE